MGHAHSFGTLALLRWIVIFSRAAAHERTFSDLRAALFVSGKNIDSDAGKRLLQSWNDAGHTLGNHTYSHSYYHSKKISTAGYIEDIERCENIIKDYAQFKKLTRSEHAENSGQQTQCAEAMS